MNISINGTEINSLKDFHEEVSSVLNFPEYYGKNLDGLYDCLTSWVEAPVTITWENAGHCRSTLGNDFERVLSVFRDAEKEVEGLQLVHCMTELRCLKTFSKDKAVIIMVDLL